MIRTGDAYRAGLRDGREIWIDGERVADVTTHPVFRPIVDAKARMYDLAETGCIDVRGSTEIWQNKSRQ